jgi:ribosomal protein L13E
VTYTREEEALRLDVTVARLYGCESDVRRRKVVERRVRRLFVWTRRDQHQVD